MCRKVRTSDTDELLTENNEQRRTSSSLSVAPDGSGQPTLAPQPPRLHDRRQLIFTPTATKFISGTSRTRILGSGTRSAAEFVGASDGTEAVRFQRRAGLDHLHPLNGTLDIRRGRSRSQMPSASRGAPGCERLHPGPAGATRRRDPRRHRPLQSGPGNFVRAARRDELHKGLRGDLGHADAQGSSRVRRKCRFIAISMATDATTSRFSASKCHLVRAPGGTTSRGPSRSLGTPGLQRGLPGPVPDGRHFDGDKINDIAIFNYGNRLLVHLQGETNSRLPSRTAGARGRRDGAGPDRRSTIPMATPDDIVIMNSVTGIWYILQAGTLLLVRILDRSLAAPNRWWVTSTTTAGWTSPRSTGGLKDAGTCCKAEPNSRLAFSVAWGTPRRRRLPRRAVDLQSANGSATTARRFSGQ